MEPVTPLHIHEGQLSRHSGGTGHAVEDRDHLGPVGGGGGAEVGTVHAVHDAAAHHIVHSLVEPVVHIHIHEVRAGAVQSGLEMVGVGVAAGGADVLVVAGLAAVGSHMDVLEAVAQGGGLIAGLHCAADGAGVGGEAAVVTSGLGDHSLPGVTAGDDGLRDHRAAVGTGHGDGAIGLTGGILGDGLGMLVGAGHDLDHAHGLQGLLDIGVDPDVGIALGMGGDGAVFIHSGHIGVEGLPLDLGVLGQGGSGRQGGLHGAGLAHAQGQILLGQTQLFRQHGLGDHGEVDGLGAVLRGGADDAGAGLRGLEPGAVDLGAVVIGGGAHGQLALAGDDLPVEGTVDGLGTLPVAADDLSGAGAHGIHAVGTDDQLGGGGFRGIVNIDLTGGGIIVEVHTPGIGHLVLVAGGVTVEDPDALGQGEVCSVDQTAGPGVACGGEVGAVQLQAHGGLGGVFVGVIHIVLGGVELHIGGLVQGGVGVAGGEGRGLALGDVHGLLVEGQVGHQIVLVLVGIQVGPVDVHGPGDAVQGHIQGAGGTGHMDGGIAGGGVVQEDLAGQAGGVVAGHIHQTHIQVGIVLVDLPADLLQLDVGGLEVDDLDDDGAIGLQAGEMLDGEVKVDDLGGALPDSNHADRLHIALGDGDGGLTGGDGPDGAELVDGGDLGVGGGADQLAVDAGVVDDAQLELAALIHQSGGLAQQKAIAGVQLHGVGAVVQAVVAAGQEDGALPLEIVGFTLAGPAFVGMGVLGNITGEGQGLGGRIVDMLRVEGVELVDVPAEVVGVLLVGALDVWVDLHGGDGAVHIVDGAGHVGPAILAMVEGDGVVLQLGGHGVDGDGEPEHIAGQVHLVAVEGGHELTGSNGIEVGDHAAGGGLVVGLAVVAVAPGGDGHDAVGAGGQGVALQVGAPPCGLGEVELGSGDGVAVGGVVQRLELPGGPVAVVQLAVFGIVDLDHHQLGLAKLVEDEVGDTVQHAVTVGGDGEVFGVVQALVAEGGVKDVLTQVDVAGHGHIAHEGVAHGGGVVEEVLAVGGCLVPNAAVEDGSGGPVAVEGQHGQADGGLVLRSQGDEALHIGAVGELLVHLGLGFSGQLHGLRDGDGLTGGDGDGAQSLLKQEHIAVQGNLHLTPGGLEHIGVGAGQGGVNRIGHIPVGEVVDLEGQIINAGALGIVLQLQLAHGLALDADEGGGGHGGGDIDQARALVAGRVEDAVLVQLGHGGGDQQMLAQVGHSQLGGDAPVLHDGLTDQQSQTGHVGGGHGGAAHHAVVAHIVVIDAGGVGGNEGGIDDGGPDVAAGGGDLGLQLQRGTCAPGGEDGHLALVRALDDLVLPADTQRGMLALGHGGLGGLIQGVAVLTGDEAGGQHGTVRAHVDQLGGIGVLVIDDDGLHGELGDIVALGGVVVAPGELGGGVDLVHKADAAATADQGDAAGTLLAVAGVVAEAGVVVVIGSAVALHGDDLPIALAQGGLHGDLKGIGEGGLVLHAVGALPEQDALGGHIVLHGGHSQTAGVDGGRGDHGGLGVGGQIAVAVLVAHGGIAGVTRGDHKGDAGLVQTLVGMVGGGVVIGPAVVGAQGQVHHIHAQQQGILQSRQDHALLGTGIGGVGEDLHDGELGIGSHAGEDDLALFGLGIACDGARHMGAVVRLGGHDIQIAVGVVGGVGDLAVLVEVVVAVGDLLAVDAGGGHELGGLQEPGQGAVGVAKLGVTQLRLEGILGEGLVDPADAGLEIAPGGVAQVQAGVHDGHQHALAGEALGPHIAKARHVVAVGKFALDGVAGGGHGAVVDPLDVCIADTVHGADGIQLAVGDAQGHGVDRVDEAILHGQLLTGGLGHQGDDVILTGLHGLCPGGGVGQIFADLLAHGGAGLRLEAGDQGCVGEFDDDGDDLIIGVEPVALLFRKLQVFQPGEAGQLLCGHDGLPGRGLLGQCQGRHQTQKHAQTQQHRKHFFHFDQSFPFVVCSGKWYFSGFFHTDAEIIARCGKGCQCRYK